MLRIFVFLVSGVVFFRVGTVLATHLDDSPVAFLEPIATFGSSQGNGSTQMEPQSPRTFSGLWPLGKDYKLARQLQKEEELSLKLGNSHRFCG